MNMRAVWYAVSNVFLLLLFLIGDALAHGAHYTEEEKAWMERQQSTNGTKCCNEHDVFFLSTANWRIGEEGYQVLIGTTWHDVPDGQIRRINHDDPSPFGDGDALLFYSVHRGVTHIWCFTPPVLM
jgi:hypothetical protein